MMSPTCDEIVSGVYRVRTSRINWYILEIDSGPVIIDAGLPTHWDQLRTSLDTIGYGPNDIEALLLTHGHPDHIGFAEQLRMAAGTPVVVHEADDSLVNTPVDTPSIHEMIVIAANLWRLPVLGLLFEIWQSGGPSVPPVRTVSVFNDRESHNVPDQIYVIHMPGHTPGSTAFYVPDRNVLFCGDALTTRDPRTGKTVKPQLMQLFNDDQGEAVESLDRIEKLGEAVLLPGHGTPWRGTMERAVELACEHQYSPDEL